MSRRVFLAAIAVLTAAFAVLSAGSALSESLTYDEPGNVREGLRAFRQRLFNREVNNPRLVREYAVLPYMITGFDGNLNRQTVFPARLMMIGLGCILILAVSRTVEVRFGSAAAVFTAFFLAFEPNLLAHGHYVSLDFGLTVFFFIAYAVFQKFLDSPTRTAAAAAGISLGWALASKAAALPFFAVSAASAVLLSQRENAGLWLYRNRGYIIGAGLLAALVIWSSYFFVTEPFISGEIHPERISSRMLQDAQNSGNTVLVRLIRLMRSVRLPLGTYLGMLKNIAVYSRLQTAQVFFLGEYRQGSQWYYLPAVALMKLTLPMIILFFSALRLAVSGRSGKKLIVPALIPALAVFTVLAMGKSYPFFRYALPAVPFIGIAAGVTLSRFWQSRFRWLAAVLLIWHGLAAAAQYPYFVSYANEITGPRSTRYRLLHDSNLDWGQALSAFRDYVAAVKSGAVSFSYFGAESGVYYGFTPDSAWSSHIFSDVCAFHTTRFGPGADSLTAISVTNWYACGYREEDRFREPDRVIADSILIFR
ncbi:hypothetical protein A2Z33_04675 [Candidatus Gottesmanbacteria bacterium RBG_16_52_11]|uniref:Glycosyltransferase RgtA/B/C/D-like domain-containing protein n=1 Tax=Candidatus Gottesmanbacteria bacterium RBG_16_52_11 TaxID=1798374 RepID=A0A1F5YUI3_9BACT|nr:MAG: hypothetical protein A2Z33_04675 [Candidatus Gottesmanbacteria bacterium RBG_16_52_11]